MDSKRKKNFSRSEVEVLLQEVNSKRLIIFSSVSSGHAKNEKKEAWNAITRSVNAVSGEGRTSHEVKKKWFDIKHGAKRNWAKYRRDTRTTGGGQDSPELSELDQFIGAIVGTTALSGVPSPEHLDSDLAPISGSEDGLPSPQPTIKIEPGTMVPEPSCSSSSIPAPMFCSSTPHRTLDADRPNSQERMAQTLTQIASTLATISETLIEINNNLKK